MGSQSVVQQVTDLLPGVIQPSPDHALWVTPGGRLAEISAHGPVVFVSWTHQDDLVFAREYDARDPRLAAYSLKIEAANLAFSAAYHPLGVIMGERFRVTDVDRTSSNTGIVIHVAEIGSRRANLELKHTVQVPAQLRRAGGVFQRQRTLSAPIIEDLWGGRDGLKKWFKDGLNRFYNDPDFNL